jgi:hypothetical protein
MRRFKKKTKPPIVRYVTLKTKGACTIDKLEVIKKEVDYGGATNTCPGWTCQQCKLMFPRVRMLLGSNPETADCQSCPCHKYEPEYLLDRLKEIIDNFPKEVKHD